MRHLTALLCAMIAGSALGAAGTAPAHADVPGFGVRVTAPATVEAGGNTRTLTAVATSEQPRCRKVRWALIVRGGRIPLDRIRVTRFEDTGEFPTRVSLDGAAATVVDEQLDPGTLCRNRTVTGRWQVAVAGRDGGEVRFEVRAFDAQGTLLSAGGASTGVTGRVATSAPRPEPTRTSAEPTPTAAEETPAEETAEPTTPADDPSPAAALATASGDSNLLGPGLVVGGVFVLLGLFLLLQLRARTLRARRQAEAAPTGFYTMP
ncbi:hypothetical protein [Actinoplanes teichomyceticus]|uniref:Uncharacterized protein n=1 Tax=Actinoplanes teichomyceticus TaxID=1867 RepID=A0A561W9V2_ACTTI|nr:hypothetical protein [Actinoplanes teichomyceticus]TWG20646.1 hypothetical protein FHX34_103175 [Actinoplanes teichomyceticus]GIF14301.1 hypothetical protein Ate01nite_43330 [Actinoplanes teichomyceticus]